MKWPFSRSKSRKKSEDLPERIIGKDEAKMVLIPAGEFEMGDHFNEGGGWECPVHTVDLNAFYMDVYEVTNALYKKFMDATGHSAPKDDSTYSVVVPILPEQPVVGVSWHDAIAYAEWSGKRLPTEAEWEKAARGGLKAKRYPWGNEITKKDANYDGDGTTAVGSYSANGYGLYDMAGNVYEWCADWYDSGYYTNSPNDNPLGPDSGTDRVLRGGSWTSDPGPLRVSFRHSFSPREAFSLVGFRCVSQD